MTAVATDSRAFLVDCLRLASIDEDITKDVAEACEIANITALDLASGKLSVQEAANQLFLTEQEVSTVMYACKEMCIQAGALAKPLVNCTAQHEEPKSADNGAATVQDVVRHDNTPVLDDDLITSPKLLKCSEPMLPAMKNPVSAEKQPSRKSLLGNSAKFANKTLYKSASVGFDAVKANEVHKKMRSFQLDDVDVDCRDDVPSYLRPTKCSTLKSQPEEVFEKVTTQQKQGFFARLGSSVFQPTAAFLARVTGRNSPQRSDNGSLQSERLSQILKSPQGQRVTKAQPFSLRTSHTKSYTSMSTDELTMRKALEDAKAYKARKTPKFVKETRPLDVHVSSTPKSPDQFFQPFKLASEQRHKEYQEQLKKKREEEEKNKVEERKFQAIKWNKKKVEKPDVPKKTALAVTVPESFTFSSDERAEYYNKVISPVKKAKEEAAKSPEQKEAEEREAELMNMPISEYRKLLDFKARKMPDLSQPFKPDYSNTKPATESVGFDLETNKRLGPTSPRTDADKQLASIFYYCGNQKATPFMASLRSSPRTSTTIKHNLRCSVDSSLKSKSHNVRESRESFTGRY